MDFSEANGASKFVHWKNPMDDGLKPHTGDNHYTRLKKAVIILDRYVRWLLRTEPTSKWISSGK